MRDNILEHLPIILLTISALGAFGAAIFTYMQAKTVSRSRETEVLLRFTERYAMRDMNDAINSLIKWRRKHGEVFADIYANGYRNEVPETEIINGHKRHMVVYFRDVLRSYQAGIINKKFVSIAISYFGYRVFREICIPMDEALSGTKYPDATALDPLYDKQDEWRPPTS